MRRITEIARELANRVIWRLADVLPALSSVVAWRERRYAHRESAAMLESYRSVQAGNPQLAGKELYEKVVAHRLACDEAEAAEVVRHADESYARWPEERLLRFRDVVHYVIVNRLLVQHARSVGTLADTEQTVTAAIPVEL
ncbi:MAG: hypothetical protein U0167_10085 [bacterium]